MLLMVFMAVTSCGSAELIAVSSLLTYDVYKTYVHPQASGEEVRIYDVWMYRCTYRHCVCGICIARSTKQSPPGD